MIEITRHMDGRTAVIGALVTAVPKHWPRIHTSLGGVPLDVAYNEDEYFVLVNGQDILPLLPDWAAKTIEQRIEADEAKRAKEANDPVLEDEAHDILQERGDV